MGAIERLYLHYIWENYLNVFAPVYFQLICHNRAIQRLCLTSRCTYLYYSLRGGDVLTLTLAIRDCFLTENIIIVHDPEGWSVSYWAGGGGGKF